MAGTAGNKGWQYSDGPLLRKRRLPTTTESFLSNRYEGAVTARILVDKKGDASFLEPARFLQREMGRRFAELLDASSDLHLMTDGKSIFLEDQYSRIIDLLKNARQPMVPGLRERPGAPH